MPLTASVPNKAKEDLQSGLHEPGDTYKIALVKPDPSGNIDKTFVSYSDLGSDEVPSGGGGVTRPTAASTGPTSSILTNYTKHSTSPVWRNGAASADFWYADDFNDGRDLIVDTGDNPTFSRCSFTGGFNVVSSWNRSGTNTITFTDCVFNSGFGITLGAGMSVVMIRCRATDGGVWFGYESATGSATLIDCEFVSIAGGDCARIQRVNSHTTGPTPFTATNTIFRTSGAINPGDHRDAIQLYGAANVSMTNCVFNLNEGEYGAGVVEGQNAAFFAENGNGGLANINLTDCWFVGDGPWYLTGFQLSTNSSLVRPRFGRGTTITYPTDHVNFQTAGRWTVSDPMYADDGTYVSLEAFGLTPNGSEGLPGPSGTSTGYTTGGATLSGRSVSSSGDVSILDWTTDPTWPASTISAIGAVIYNDTQVGKPVLAILSFGGTVSSVNGTFTVQLPAPSATTGVLRIL